MREPSARRSPGWRASLRAVVAVLAAMVALSAPMARAAAQAQGVQVIPPSAGGDSLQTVTPTFLLQAVATGPGPLRYRFEIDTTPRFTRPVLDTSFTTSDSNVAVRPARALESGVRIYWRATVINPAGLATSSPIGGPRRVPRWVTPREPSGFSGTIVYTRRPTFVWSSPQVGEPPGPWEYQVDVSNFGVGVVSRTTRDTVFQIPPGAELETNAGYTWTITARLPGTGQSFSVTPGTFTVLDSLIVPTATLVYQNFPNPFPNLLRRATCIWVDIAQPTRATLDIWTLRGVRVRRLLPNASLGDLLAPRRYGREIPGSGRGCDPDFEWDGRDDRGDLVPAGVYLMRFRAEGVETVKKIVFRGG
ncbi:MAG: hypothetical protein ACXWZ4_13735 [Gemmatirosa sp.]